MLTRVAGAAALLQFYVSRFGSRGAALWAERVARRVGGRRLVENTWGRWRGEADFVFEPRALVPSIDEAGRAWYRDRFGGAIERRRAAADRIIAGRFEFLGVDSDRWPREIDWHLDPASGYRWGLDFYETYLSSWPRGREVKIPWELSRGHHLVALAQAWTLTGDRRYSAALFAQLDDWIEANPWLRGINWAVGMEAGIRAVNFAWASALASAAPEWTLERARRIGRTLAQHGRFLEHNLEIGVRAGSVVVGNHYLAEVSALACLGLMCEGAPGAARWRRLGFAALERSIRDQVGTDGAYLEPSTLYHRFALEMFLVPAVLARAAGVHLSDGYWDRLERMFEPVMHLTAPDGCVPQIGDNDDGRFVILSGYPAWSRHDQRYLLSIGAALFGRRDFKAAAGETTEDVYWLLGRERVEQADALRQDAIAPESSALPSAGIYVIRGSGGRDCVMFRTAMSEARAPRAHAHNDTMSVLLWLEGRELLSDSGTLSYTADPQARNVLRGSAAHNVLVVDGEEINRLPASLFDMPMDAQIGPTEWMPDGDVPHVATEHDGYARLTSPVIHRRRVSFTRSQRRCEVRDELRGHAREASLYWHFAPGVNPTLMVAPDRLSVRVEADSGRMTIRWSRCVQSNASIADTKRGLSYGRTATGRTLRVDFADLDGAVIETTVMHV